MATDAPKLMDFNVNVGNSVHINLYPNLCTETQYVFDKLLHGGQITMPWQGMFLVAYYGSCTDTYGVMDV